MLAILYESTHCLDRKRSAMRGTQQCLIVLIHVDQYSAWLVRCSFVSFWNGIFVCAANDCTPHVRVHCLLVCPLSTIVCYFWVARTLVGMLCGVACLCVRLLFLFAVCLPPCGRNWQTAQQNKFVHLWDSRVNWQILVGRYERSASDMVRVYWAHTCILLLHEMWSKEMSFRLTAGPKWRPNSKCAACDTWSGCTRQPVFAASISVIVWICLPANGTSAMYSTQSVDSLRSDNDTELSDPLDAFNECDMITSDEHGDKLLSR